MANAIPYDVPPPPEENGARQELDQLLENLHDQGILRFINDVLRASPAVTKILLNGLNTEESRNAVQNLSLLAMALGRIPPSQFANVTRAFSEAVDSMTRTAADEGDEKAPGLIGTYKLLHDDALWQSLRPVLAGLKGFSNRIHEQPAKPAAKRNDGTGTDGSGE